MREIQYNPGDRDGFNWDPQNENPPKAEEGTSRRGQILVYSDRLLFTPKADASYKGVQTLAERVSGGWRPFFALTTITNREYVSLPTDGYLSNVLRGVLSFPSERFRHGAGMETLTGFVNNLEGHAKVSPEEMSRIRHILTTIAEELHKI